jgi:hypothetical protein
MKPLLTALLMVVLLVSTAATPAHAWGCAYWPWPVAILAAPLVVASALVAAPLIIVGSAVAATTPPAVAPVPPMVVSSPAPVVVARAAPPAPAPTAYWYYCPEPAGYYPYVQRCSTSWLTVVPPTGPPPTTLR